MLHNAAASVRLQKLPRNWADEKVLIYRASSFGSVRVPEQSCARRSRGRGPDPAWTSAGGASSPCLNQGNNCWAGQCRRILLLPAASWC